MSTINARSFAQVPSHQVNGVHSRFSRPQTFSTATDFEAADLVRFFKIPKYSRFIRFDIEVSDMDTNGAPAMVVDVVIANGSDAVQGVPINDWTGFQTGGTVTSEVATFGNQTGWKNLVTLAEDWWVGIRIVTAAATFAAGNIQLGVQYSLDMEDLYVT